MEFAKTFGETVRQLREKRGLTLREVADALEIDTSMLGKIEKNNRKPNRQMIENIAIYFRVSERRLRIAFLSDSIVYQVIDDADLSNEIFKVAEEKIKYFTTPKISKK